MARRSRQAVLLRQLRAGIHSADGARRPTLLTRGSRSRASSAIRPRPASSARRTCCRSPRQNGFPSLDGSDHRGAARETARGDEPGRGAQHEQPPHAELRLARAQQGDLSTSRRRVSTTRSRRTLVLDGQLQPVAARDTDGRRQWPHPGLARCSSRSSARWWIGSTGAELDDRPAHAQRVPLRHAAQRRHDEPAAAWSSTTRTASSTASRARFSLPFGLAELVQDAAPITGTSLHHDDLRHDDDAPRQSHHQARRHVPLTGLARHVARRRRHRGHPRLPALQPGLAGRRSRPVDLQRDDHARHSERGSRPTSTRCTRC